MAKRASARAARARAAAEKRHKEACTFKPKINQWVGPGNSAAAATAGSSSTNGRRRQQRFEALATSGERKYGREQRRREHEQRSCAAAHSSLSSVVPRAPWRPGTARCERGRGGRYVPVEERLHHGADHRAEMRERARRRMEESRSEHQFQHAISAATDRILTRRVPPHTRAPGGAAEAEIARAAPRARRARR